MSLKRPLSPFHMIAEPYICTTGKETGTIRWFDQSEFCVPIRWVPYADFEQARLEELGSSFIGWHVPDGFTVLTKSLAYLNSRTLTDYDVYDYRKDDESGRLLARARFLKAACEKEGVEWLPSPAWQAAQERAEKISECLGIDCPKPWTGKLSIKQGEEWINLGTVTNVKFKIDPCMKRGAWKLRNEQTGEEVIGSEGDETFTQAEVERQQADQRRFLSSLLRLIEKPKTGEDALRCLGALEQEIARKFLGK